MGEHLPDSIARMVEEIINPKIDWREALRRFVSALARDDYSWTPPNRRYIHQGLYLPSLRSEKLGDIVVAVDTSGSISPKDLDQFGAELTAIMEEHPGTEAHVVYCDTAIRGTAHVTSDDLPLTLEARGGGGTDFRPPFAWVEEQNINPVALVYLTDMECSRFPDAPTYPVLWVRTGSGGGDAPFGEVIDL
jgi:predicted metal-dependent peptidase